MIRLSFELNSRTLSFAFLLLLCLFSCSVSSLAHQGSSSYLTVAVEGNRIAGRWDVPVSDLDLALKLDADGDHKVSLDELRSRYSDVKAYALRHLKLSSDGAPGAILFTNTEPAIQVFVDGASTPLNFIVTNLTPPRILEVDYRFMFDLKPLDRGFMQVECRGITQAAVFTANRPIHRFNLEVPTPAKDFLFFVWHGMWHIWIGFDHILFLLALLLPAVLRFEQNRWEAVSDFRQAFVNVFKVVTAFTVAHSLTLSLAALQILRLPSRWVESAIAASVLLAAMNNVRPLIRGRIWLVAFGFGLIHGFGFANVLTELGLPRRALVVALVAFNLGVELGQLAIVSLFLPLAFALRRTLFYQYLLLKPGSALIAVIASLWLVERVFDWKFLPF